MEQQALIPEGSKPIESPTKRALTPVTLALTGATLLVFWQSDGDPSLLPRLTLDLSALELGEWWRLWTRHAIQSSGFGLGVTVIVVFLMMARPLELLFGSLRFAALTLLFLTASSCAELLWPPASEVTRESGSLFLGYLGASLGAIYHHHGRPWPFLKDPAVLRYAFFLALFLALEASIPASRSLGNWAALATSLPASVALLDSARPGRRARGFVGVTALSVALSFACIGAIAPRHLPAFLSGGSRSQSARAALDPRPLSKEQRAEAGGAAARLPDNDESAFERGVLWLRAGRPGEALYPLRRAIKLAPDEALRHALLGRAYLEVDNPIDARACFERARVLSRAAPLPELDAWLARCGGRR